MAQQDDIIEIKTVESITTSILDYFLNIALVSEFDDQLDIVSGGSFDEKGYEVYSSLSDVAKKFQTSSAVYKIARDIFNQKTNNGINQSNMKRFIVIRKLESDETFEDCLNRVGYKNSYFMMVNPKEDNDIESVNNWVDSRRKLLFVQSSNSDIADSGNDDIASVLKNKSATRTAFYYHGLDGESLAGAICAILSSNPVGRKNASYKKPSDITVDNLTSTQEKNLNSKNVNYYVPFIGGAGDYSTRELTSANGVVSSGDEIQKIICVDRTILSLQASLMDALIQDIPYDDNGGTVLYDKINAVFSELKREGIFAEDSVDEITGELIKSYNIKVLTRATVKKHYPDYFAQKMFIVECEVQLAGSGKKVALTLAY